MAVQPRPGGESPSSDAASRLAVPGATTDDRPAEPPDPRAEGAAAIVAMYLKSARATQLYPRRSRIRADAVAEFAAALVAHLAEHGETVLEIRQSDVRAFDAVVYAEENRQKSFAFKLFVNGVRAIAFRPGLTAHEAEGVVDVLTIAFRPDASAEEIQTAVWERCFDHVAFEIEEEAFSTGDDDAFDGFLAEDETDPLSAEPAREAEERVCEELLALPAREEDDAAPVVVGADERARIEEMKQRELSRDLFAEVAGFLLDALQSRDAEAVRGTLEEFIEHLLAAGDVLRAARMLAHLRRLAAEQRDPAGARALSDVVERIGRSKIVPALAPLAETLTPADREGFTMLLVALGESALDPLLAMVGGAAHEHALHALTALAQRHPRAVAARVEDPRPEVVRAVIAILAPTLTRESVAAILPALRNADPAVRRDALKVVVATGTPQLTQVLLEVLEDPVYELRAIALDALGARRDPRAVATLLARIRAPRFASLSQYERRELFRAVGRVGTPEATAALAEILRTRPLVRRDAHEEMRALAAFALALAGNSGARAALRRQEGDRSPLVRTAVQHALREVERRSPAASAPPAVGPPRR